MRIRPDVSLATLKTIAASSKAEEDVVTGYQGVADLLREQYGSNHEKIRAVFNSFNTALGKAKWDDAAGVDVTLPAAPRWLFRVRVPGIAAISLRDQARLLMGDAGEKTRHAIEALNPELAGKWNEPVSGTVTFPYVAEYVTYELKPGTDAQELLRKVQTDPGISILKCSWSVGSVFEANDFTSGSLQSALPFGTPAHPADDLSTGL